VRTYGQYCPIARGAEIFAERWTPLIIRNLNLGCGSFSEILEGAPGLSRTLLSQRLRQLERLGIVESAPKPGGPERLWLLIERGDTEICKTYPGLNEDLYITAEAEAFVKWHAGQLSWVEATRDRRIQLHGPSWLVRAFPTWNARSAFAHIKPVSRTEASSAA
jgi:DNA-binding HxlR family transcriptional regulator